MLQNRKSNRRVDPSAIGLLRRKSRKIYYLQLETLRMICIRFMKQPLTLHLNARILKMDFLLKVQQLLKYSLLCMWAQYFKFTKLKIIQIPEKQSAHWMEGGKKARMERTAKKIPSSASYIDSKLETFVSWIYFHQFSLSS